MESLMKSPVPQCMVVFEIGKLSEVFQADVALRGIEESL